MGDKKKTVLAIDDVSLSLLIIKDALSPYVNVYIAKSGKRALEMLEFVEVDLFLVDLNMPDMNGFEFIDNLRKMPQYETTPIIVVSGNDKQDTVLEAVKQGIRGYITKPLNQNILRDKVVKELGI